MVQAFAHKSLKPPVLIDLFLLLTTIGLVGFSLVMLYSTTGTVAQERFGDSLFFVKRQSVAALIGAVALLFCSRLRLSHLRRIAPVCFFVAIILLVLPLVPFLGDSAGGAQRWVNLGGLHFQPGEFAKVLFVIFMASFFVRHEGELGSFLNGFVKPGLFLIVVAVLYLLEPDFGSTVVVGAVTLAMAVAAGVRLRHLLFSFICAVAAMSALIYSSPYRMKRILSFLEPWEDASGSGYQLIQSLIAVGSGRLTGVGVGASQQKLFFLPAAHTDFIFAVIGEELGFIGCVLLIAAFLVFLWRGFVLAARLTDNIFAYTLAVGLTLLIVLPALLNIGVVIGVLPTKGMVLPFVGYGGSSLIASLITVGLLLGITRDLYESGGNLPKD